MVEMKACPKCGGKGKHKYVKPYHWVVCTDCRYKTPPCCDYYEENDAESIATVINYWNYGVDK